MRQGHQRRGEQGSHVFVPGLHSLVLYSPPGKKEPARVEASAGGRGVRGYAAKGKGGQGPVTGYRAQDRSVCNEYL